MKRIVSIFLILTTLCAGLLSADVLLSSIKQLTIGATGEAANGDSQSPKIAPNGRFVVFSSTATNLQNSLPAVRGANSQIFRLDLNSNELTLISKSLDGVAGDGESEQPTISAIGTDGIYGIAYTSNATNLGYNSQSGGYKNVYVHVPKHGIELSLTSGNDFGPPNGDSGEPTISYVPDKRSMIVAFSSDSNNIYPSDTNGNKDIYFESCVLKVGVADCESANMGLVSKGFNNTQANDDSFTPHLSGDGRYIVFASKATNLIAEGTPTRVSQIYRYSMNNGQIELVSRGSDGAAGSGDSSNPTISYSGQFIAFETKAANIVDSSSVKKRVVLVDLISDTTSLVDQPLDPSTAFGDSTVPRISPDGRFVTFQSTVANLVENDFNSVSDIFLYDSESTKITRVSQNVSGEEGEDASGNPVLAFSSFANQTALVVFPSLARNLTASPTAAGILNLYKADFLIEPPTLKPDTVLETPADVVPKKRAMKVVMQRFSGIANSTQSASAISLPASKKKRVEYDVRIVDKSRGKNRIRHITNRNKTTVRDVKPGTYYVKYRVSSKSGDKTVRTTGFSPRQTVKVK